MNTKIPILFAIALLLVALMFASFNMPESVTAAPPAAPTAVSNAAAQSNSPSALVVAFSPQQITADSRACFDASGHEKADIHWKIDQGTVNTTTLRLQHTNYTPNAFADYVNGAAIVSSNAADASDMAQLQVFGAWTCVQADVANSNALSLTVRVLLR